MPGSSPHKYNPSATTSMQQEHLSQLQLGAEEASIQDCKVYKIRGAQTGKVLKTAGNRELWVGGTAADGSYIAPHNRGSSGSIATAKPEHAIQIKDVADLIRLLELEAIHDGRSPLSDGKQYTRNGFSGSYRIQRESDGSLSCFYSGGEHISGQPARPQTFHHGQWDVARTRPRPVAEQAREEAVLPPLPEPLQHQPMSSNPNTENSSQMNPTEGNASEDNPARANPAQSKPSPHTQEPNSIQRERTLVAPKPRESTPRSTPVKKPAGDSDAEDLQAGKPVERPLPSRQAESEEPDPSIAPNPNSRTEDREGAESRISPERSSREIPLPDSGRRISEKQPSEPGQQSTAQGEGQFPEGEDRSEASRVQSAFRRLNALQSRLQKAGISSALPTPLQGVESSAAMPVRRKELESLQGELEKLQRQLEKQEVKDQARKKQLEQISAALSKSLEEIEKRLEELEQTPSRIDEPQPRDEGEPIELDVLTPGQKRQEGEEAPTPGPTTSEQLPSGDESTTEGRKTDTPEPSDSSELENPEVKTNTEPGTEERTDEPEQEPAPEQSAPELPEATKEADSAELEDARERREKEIKALTSARKKLEESLNGNQGQRRQEIAQLEKLLEESLDDVHEMLGGKKSRERTEILDAIKRTLRQQGGVLTDAQRAAMVGDLLHTAGWLEYFTPGKKAQVEAWVKKLEKAVQADVKDFKRFEQRRRGISSQLEEIKRRLEETQLSEEE